MNDFLPGRSHGAEERIRTLIIRVWRVSDAGRQAAVGARLVEAKHTVAAAVAAVEGADAICRTLREWLDQLADP
ncbi:hypothetical protein [Streptomyces sp. NPDC102487]|uniref:hypothetical protein n=1 Tax=Streptomyces sp. NPDC102487 TaxID=3366182 RepID=UPI0038172690